jgi:predicted dehydrogenase
MTDTTRVALLGTGNIGPQYVRGVRAFRHLALTTCADIDEARAQAFAREHDLRALSVDALLAAPDIDIIINLTIPRVHAELSSAIVRAGKHVYSEKPLATGRADAQALLNEAEAAGVRVGCAPDTFLGGGLQTCRRLIDDGAIGDPVAATGFMGGHGPDEWHPNPWMFYQPGAGPMLDMGPYYLTALVTLLGDIRRVAGIARASFPVRTAGHESVRGQSVPVEVPTHISGTLQFASGAVASLTTTFDIWAHRQPIIEIYGSHGTLRVPDPNSFGGAVELWTTEAQDWRIIPLTHSDSVGRGIGVADMAAAIRADRPHRASGALALHVLDAMLAFEESSQSGEHVSLHTHVDRPDALGVDEAVGW